MTRTVAQTTQALLDYKEHVDAVVAVKQQIDREQSKLNGLYIRWLSGDYEVIHEIATQQDLVAKLLYRQRELLAGYS